MKNENYPIVKLLAGKEQSWQFGHPWIYSRAIDQMPSLPPGTLVNVLDHKEKFLGVGYIHPKQSIAIRMLDPQAVMIDGQWFLKRLRSLDHYRKLFLDPTTTAYRLCYGESDGIPGLVIDRFEGIASIQINTKGMERLLPHLIQCLPALGMKEWIVQGNSVSSKKEGVSIDPAFSKISSEFVWAKENGLQIYIPMRDGQKTGWFCDQRDNRLSIKELASKHQISSILNLFAYTAGFSLSALSGGAKRVLNVDLDKKALALFDLMLEKNHLRGNTESLVANAWEYLSTAQETFELVIVDPPAFVKEASKKAIGLKGYRDLFKQSIARVATGGFLAIFSCSHFVQEEDLNWVMRQVFADSKRVFQTVQIFGQSFDHPVPAWFPEGRYLKGLLLKEI
jgi:23S rRNA (cytosine1962-C5)-methyltransferase